MTDHQTDTAEAPEVAHGELVSHGSEAVEPVEAEERREAVEEPAKVMRIGSMIIAGMVRSKKLNRLARNSRNRMRQAFAAWVEFCMGPSLLLLWGVTAPGTCNLVSPTKTVCNYSLS